MAKEIELSSLDLRYEGHRMKNPGLEERLLVSIAQRGIEEPLEGVQRQQASILLNGFKRYRCAHKLQLRSVPYASLGEDEVAAIMNLLRISNNRALSILEQAAFIDELLRERLPERSRDGKRAFAQQILGKHAPGTDLRDERGDTGQAL